MNIRTLFAVLFCAFILSSCGGKSLTVTLKNPTTTPRLQEDVEISWREIQTKIPEITPEQLLITTGGKEQVYQVVYTDKLPTSVLIQASVPAGGEIEYKFKQGTPSQFDPLTFGRLVPERKDDFAWENNKVAYRMYGPALEATGELSNGIDVWAKRTDKLIIDKWYKLNDYHKDHGEGLDYYKVGRTLGAGAIAPMADTLIVLGKNYIRSEVIENGPLRTTFKLYYAPLKVREVELVESRIISLSANSHFNKITQVFEGDFSELAVASGIVLRQKKGDIVVDEDLGMIAYQEPEMGKNGQLSIAVLLGDHFKGSKESQGHLLALASMKSGVPLIYYMGNAWNKAGFETPEKWLDYTKEYATQLKQPLEISYK